MIPFASPRNGPPTCLGRYSMHLSGWIDEQGQNRCRRCHEPLPPKKPYHGDYGSELTPWSKSTRGKRIERGKAQTEAAKPRTHVQNPDCKHPPPIADPVQAHLDAQRRMDAGEEQRECPFCHDWVWKQLFTDPPQATAPLAASNSSGFDAQNGTP